jgi:hypothetical protein
MFLLRPNRLIFFLLIFSIILPSCAKKSQKNSIRITGQLRISDEIKKELSDATVFIGVSDTPFHELIDNPIEHTKHFIASKDLNSYELSFDSKTIGDGNKDLQIYAFIDRDFSPKKSPRLSKGDYIGFYMDDFKPGISVDLSATREIKADIPISRSSLGRRLSVEFENSDPFFGTFHFGMYCGEIEGLSPKSFKKDQVIFIKPFQKQSSSIKERFNFELFQSLKTDYCYAFGFHDANDNMKLDNDEQFGFYSDRQDELPAQIDIRPDAIGPLQIKLKYKVPPTRDSPIVLK